MRLGVHGFAAVALAAGAMGCGGEDPPPAEPIDSLSRYLPSDSGLLVFADLAAAREQLGLPADADALSFEIVFDDDYDPRSPEARLVGATRAAMPMFGFKTYTSVSRPETVRDLRDIEFDPRDLEPDPVTEAFDGTAIAAAATGGAGGGQRGSLTAIRTSQPFDELADALAKEGYEREDDVLSKPGAPINEVADAGDGVVVFSSEEASAAEAVADPGGGVPEALALLEPADEPLAEAIAGLGDDDCLTGYGGWENATGSSGALRIAIDGPADLERVGLGQFEKFAGAEIGEPRAEGNTVVVPFSDGGEGISSPLRNFVHTSLGIGVYDCD